MRVRQTLTVLRRTDGTEDAHGNPIHTWTEEPWPIFGWVPVSSQELFTVGPNRIVVERVVYAPTAPAETARVRFPNGQLFEVTGEPGDWNRGPFGYRPGYAVNLGRTDG